MKKLVVLLFVSPVLIAQNAANPRPESPRYEAQFTPGVTLTPIPSLWGHTAGAASNPADAKFLNETIARFLAAGR